ncbi:MAG: prolyl-tRNA synthetase associated domain-containing protein [Alphaproteobacteria bacterium]|nr:prolyl-tRNA synthetase associated domain-containing protein [Alphaproteobacteria bacterium]
MNDIIYDPEILEIEQTIYQRLTDLNITFETFRHAPLFTVEQALDVMDDISGAHVKNLFLRDKKKNFFLITAYHQTDIDLKTLRHKINANGNLSFASADDLWAQLKIRPGSVNPLVLINVAPDANIRFFIDKKLTEAESVNLHPMRNDKSITLKSDDLMAFLKDSGHNINVFDFSL